jgi:hypothetical protein
MVPMNPVPQMAQMEDMLKGMVVGKKKDQIEVLL